MDDCVAQDETTKAVVGDGPAERFFEHRTMAGVFRIPDAMWERIEPLISPAKTHRFGGGRRRVPDSGLGSAQPQPVLLPQFGHV